MPGLTENGLTIRSLDEVKAHYEELFKAAFGDIDTDPASTFGQFIGVISEPAAEIWEEVENVYQNQYPTGAAGVSLDNTMQYNNLFRLESTTSKALATVYGDQGTVVPAFRIFSTLETANRFYSLVDVTIDKAVVIDSTVTVDTVANSYVYDVIINSTSTTYTSDSDATEGEITEGIKTSINNAFSIVEAINNFDGTVTIKSTDLETSYSIDVGTNLSITTIGSTVDTESINRGAISAPTGTLTVIDTPVSGLDSVYNFFDATLGRETETDPNAKLRRLNSLAISGKATLDSMYANITQNVADVTEVTVYENITDITDPEGRPPHSIEVNAIGGEDTDLAREIWESKAAGIQTHGNSSAIHIDNQGFSRVINFTRPTDQYTHIFVNLTLSIEEDFPDNGVQLVSDNLLAYGNTFNIGQDLIIQKFYTPIYSVTGIDSADVFIDLTANPGDTPSYVTTNISVSSSEIAVFDSSRIFVNII